MNGLTDQAFKRNLYEMELLSPDGEESSLYFVADRGAAQDPHIRVALETAVSYEADAVFFRIFPDGDKRAPVPQIYVYSDTSLCSIKQAKHASIHKRLWNAGVVPLALIFTPEQIKTVNCRQEPRVDSDTYAPIFTPFEALEKLVVIDRTCVAREITAGTFWENPSFKNDFALENTAYYKLLCHLKNFRNDLLTHSPLSEQTLNRILVMAILMKYLNDRRDSAGNGVFQPAFFKQFSSSTVVGDVDLVTLFRENGGCVRLFENLSAHFNGGIFELSEEEKLELRAADLSQIADFLQGDQEPSGQGLFWPLYSFEDLPVELISNIYEEFLAEKEKGVVYTPPMLVDLLLDQCLPLAAGTLSWKILDPACGSGIFLVGAFKRLIQCWRVANEWRKPALQDLQAILKDCVFGFDKSPEAVLISVFSLSVALCDELDPLVIWNTLRFDNLRKKNLIAKDFFEVVRSNEPTDHFDLVIGNPPFESKLTTEAAIAVEAEASKKRPKLPDAQLALLFLEQAYRMLKKEGRICLIQPAGPLLYNINALSFRKYLFDNFAIDQVFDFTALEGILFSRAQVAAAAILGSNTAPSTDNVLHITFRRTRTIKDKVLFELDAYDFHWLSRKAAGSSKYAWKANLLGGGRLHRVINRLFSDVPTLGEYLEEKRKTASWQFAEGYSIGCGSYLNKSPSPQSHVELTPEQRMELFKLKRTPKLASWITGELNLPAEALTRKGIDWQAMAPCKDLFFEETRPKVKEIFLKPHVLIREVAEGGSIPARYVDKDLVFTKQVIGVHAPEKDSDKLLELASRLNDSGVYGVLAAVISSRMLVGRASSLLKSDIMALPYPEQMHEFVLNPWEQALIDDVGNHFIDFRRNGENSSILDVANDDDLAAFGEMYCSTLNTVYKKFRPLTPVISDMFVFYPFCFGDAPAFDLPDAKKIVSFLRELLHRQHSSRLFVNRILRIYEQNVTFLIKPAQRRYWLRSIALRDADETMTDLLEQGY